MGTHPSNVQDKQEYKKTQPKEKTKANNQQKLGKDPMQKGLMTTKWQSTITYKTLDEKVIICHKLASNRGALPMMCGRDEEPQPSAVAH